MRNPMTIDMNAVIEEMSALREEALRLAEICDEIRARAAKTEIGNRRDMAPVSADFKKVQVAAHDLEYRAARDADAAVFIGVGLFPSTTPAADRAKSYETADSWTKDRGGAVSDEERAERKRGTERDSTAKRRARLAAAGICINCGSSPADEGSRYCAACREKMKIASKERVERFRAAGLCTYCGKNVAEPGKAFCADCARKQALRNARKRSKTT